MTSPATLGPTAVGPGDLRAVMGGYRDALRLHQSDINRLNVYPVPDGDTGTNMALTLEAVVSELEAVGPGRRPGRGLPGHRARVAHGGPGQLGGHPLAAAARDGRADGHRRARRRRPRAPGRRPGPRGRAGPPGGRPAGGGDDPDRGLGRGGGSGRGGLRRRVGGRGRARQGRGRRCAGPDARDAARCWPGRAWWTPAGPGSSSCSTPFSWRSTAGPCPSPRAWRPRTSAALQRGLGRRRRVGGPGPGCGR